MFPARAGMSLAGMGGSMAGMMFPARAGMSRFSPAHPAEPTDVPRASGDEPIAGGHSEELLRCSPRERG